MGRLAGCGLPVQVKLCRRAGTWHGVTWHRLVLLLASRALLCSAPPKRDYYCWWHVAVVRRRFKPVTNERERERPVTAQVPINLLCTVSYTYCRQRGSSDGQRSWPESVALVLSGWRVNIFLLQKMVKERHSLPNAHTVTPSHGCDVHRD
jgi:hypothetical protein